MTTNKKKDETKIIKVDDCGLVKVDHALHGHPHAEARLAYCKAIRIASDLASREILSKDESDRFQRQLSIIAQTTMMVKL
jgi:hypothetical protein